MLAFEISSDLAKRSVLLKKFAVLFDDFIFCFFFRNIIFDLFHMFLEMYDLVELFSCSPSIDLMLR